MTEHDFEQQLARRLLSDAEHGVRPYDAIEVARAAMWSGGRQPTASRRRGGPPAWFRSMVLAGLLVVLLVAAAFVGGLIRLPNVNVVPTASPTNAAEVSPSPIVGPSLIPTLVPTQLPSPDPSASPGPSPDVSPEPSPSPSPSPSPNASPSISPEPSPALSPSPEPSPTTSPTPATGWREIEGFPTGRRTSLTDVAHGRAGFVIVARGGGGSRSWFSSDGVSWTRSTDSSFPGAAHVVAMDGQFYAISNAGVWRSADGLSWTQLTSSPGLGFINDVIVDNGVMIAVGTDGDFRQASIWLSGDGVTWTPHGGPVNASELTQVAARGGDLAVIGDGPGGHGRRIFFRPAHTSDWLQFDPFGEDQDGRLLAIASNGGSFVAVGYWDDWESGRRRGLSLSSEDGSSWTRSLISDRDSLVFDQLVTTPDNRYLAIASESYFIVGECQPDACVFLQEDAFTYESANGNSWSPRAQVYHRYEASDPGDMIEHPRSVAAGGPGVVIVDDQWLNGSRVFFAPLGAH